MADGENGTGVRLAISPERQAAIRASAIMDARRAAQDELLRDEEQEARFAGEGRSGLGDRPMIDEQVVPDHVRRIVNIFHRGDFDLAAPYLRSKGYTPVKREDGVIGIQLKDGRIGRMEPENLERVGDHVLELYKDGVDSLDDILEASILVATTAKSVVGQGIKAGMGNAASNVLGGALGTSATDLILQGMNPDPVSRTPQGAPVIDYSRALQKGVQGAVEGALDVGVDVATPFAIKMASMFGDLTNPYMESQFAKSFAPTMSHIDDLNKRSGFEALQELEKRGEFASATTFEEAERISAEAIGAQIGTKKHKNKLAKELDTGISLLSNNSDPVPYKTIKGSLDEQTNFVAGLYEGVDESQKTIQNLAYARTRALQEAAVGLPTLNKLDELSKDIVVLKNKLGSLQAAGTRGVGKKAKKQTKKSVDALLQSIQKKEVARDEIIQKIETSTLPYDKINDLRKSLDQKVGKGYNQAYKDNGVQQQINRSYAKAYRGIVRDGIRQTKELASVLDPELLAQMEVLEDSFHRYGLHSDVLEILNRAKNVVKARGGSGPQFRAGRELTQIVSAGAIAGAASGAPIQTGLGVAAVMATPTRSNLGRAPSEIYLRQAQFLKKLMGEEAPPLHKTALTGNWWTTSQNAVAALGHLPQYVVKSADELVKGQKQIKIGSRVFQEGPGTIANVIKSGILMEHARKLDPSIDDVHMIMDEWDAVEQMATAEAERVAVFIEDAMKTKDPAIYLPAISEVSKQYPEAFRATYPGSVRTAEGEVLPMDEDKLGYSSKLKDDTKLSKAQRYSMRSAAHAGKVIEPPKKRKVTSKTVVKQPVLEEDI